MRYTVIDVETPNRQNNRISAIACVIVDSWKITERKYSLCNPEVPLEPFNAELTGLSEEQLSEAPTFPELWPIFAPLFEDTVIVAHNATFDLSVLKKCLAAYQLPPLTGKYCCTCKMGRLMWPQLKNHKLNTICEYLELPLDHHKAESDALACANILLAMGNNGFPIEKHISPLHFNDADLSCSPTFRAKLSRKTEEINELLRILSDVSGDGALTEMEIQRLVYWLTQHEHLRGEYQFDELYDAISATLEDGYIDGEELDSLLSLCETLIDPVGNLSHTEGIMLQGKSVCLTGTFDCGSKSEVEALIKNRGGSVVPRVTQTLDYLIVGGQGSSAWASANYGTKVKKALEFQSKGFHIQIIRESDAFSQEEALTRG